MSVLEIIGAVTLSAVTVAFLCFLWLGCLIIKDMRKEGSE